MKRSGNYKKTHGQYKARLYHVWVAMIQRCTNPKCKAFKNYGGRGIEIHTQWMSFVPFMEWSKANGYADGLTIDRIDNEGNYAPENCQWIPRPENSAKTRRTHFITAFGETKTIEDWVSDPRCKVKNPGSFRTRIRLGWTGEEIVSKEIGSHPEKGFLYLAFGEWKTSKQWSDDPRCSTSLYCLRQRLRRGMNPEKAISSVTRKPRPVNPSLQGKSNA